MTNPATPVTGDLSRVIDACLIVERELDYQIERLAIAGNEARSERRNDDYQHLASVGQEYTHGRASLRRLRRHLQKRMAERIREARAIYSAKQMTALRYTLDLLDQEHRMDAQMVTHVEREFEHPLAELRLIAATEPGRPYGGA